MKLKTKRTIELENVHFYQIKEIERIYGVRIIIEDGRRVDKYEAEQSYRELHRSNCFKDVKVTTEYAVKARFWFYRNILKLSYADAMERLSNSDFLRSKETIKKYLGGFHVVIGETEIYEIDNKIPLFDWSISGNKNKRVSVYKNRVERKKARERIIASYYYFYGDCLNYTDVNREYVICYRDFDISPKQLQRIINEYKEYIEELRTSQTTVEDLRKMYPAFAWNCSISFNDWDEIPEDCDSVRNSLDVYTFTKFSKS